MIIFLYGQDTFRSRQKLRELKEKFINDVDRLGNSITVINGESANMSQISEVIAPSSLFSSKRLVVIENIFSNKSKTIQDQVNEYINKNTDTDNIVIFWDNTSGEKMGKNKLFTTLIKERFVQQFKPLSNTDATTWVKREIKNRGANISHQTAFLLTSFFGSDLWQLSQEINKLINFKRAKNQGLGIKVSEVEIVKEDVEELSRGNLDENIFALTDAISTKNKAKALEFFEKELAAGVTEVYLLNMITRQFKILIQVRESLDMGLTQRKMISDLKLHPFVVQKSMSQVRNFNIPILKLIISQLVEMDMKLKTGQGDLKTELTLLITKL